MKRSFLQLLVLMVVTQHCKVEYLNPVRESKMIKRPPRNQMLIVEPQSYVTLTPAKNLHVRSIQDCKILYVIHEADSSIIVIAKGKVMIGYGNLRKVYIEKGDSIKRDLSLANFILFQKKRTII